MKKNKNGIISVFLILAISISISYKSDFFEIAKQIEIYTTLYKELNLYYIDEINPAEFTEKAINSTLNNLDPYTRFYDEQGVEDAKISAEGQYGGIGALTAYRNGNLILREIYKDYPAHKSGLLSGDEIIKIDGVS
jgi:carboxyl-terminal processing protease